MRSSNEAFTKNNSLHSFIEKKLSVAASPIIIIMIAFVWPE